MKHISSSELSPQRSARSRSFSYVHSTVTRWLNERPEYAQAYRLAREAQADRLFDLAWRIACEATAKPCASAS